LPPERVGDELAVLHHLCDKCKCICSSPRLSWPDCQEILKKHHSPLARRRRALAGWGAGGKLPIA